MTTQHLKLRTINTASEEELKDLRNLSKNDPWKPTYHIHPQHGLINDPNGLAYYNGEYHTFYQWFPFDAIHGMKHWAYAKSKDLATWERMDVAITPLESYEKNGAYSGASLEVDGNLYLYYTGNVKYDDGGRTANQCVSIMTPDGTITKYENNPVVKGVPTGYTGHVRDPKVFKKNDMYYMILGAQRENKTGTIIVYKSIDALDWEYHGELHVPIDEEMIGFMWECPDYYEIDGKDVLVFSPQGVEPNGHDYHNIYNVIYVFGSLDIENLTFVIEKYKELDKGFDFYAPQSFVGENGEQVMFGWAGLPEIDYPSDKLKWSQCLTLPRKMSIKNNKLIQQPVTNLENLRTEKFVQTSCITNETVTLKNERNMYELAVEFTDINANHFSLEFFASNEEKLTLQFDCKNEVVTLDRSNVAHPFAVNFGTKRSENIEIGKSVSVVVYADQSIAEIFINGGEIVFTTRIFPLEQSKNIRISTDGTVTYSAEKYDLKQGIEI